MGEFKSEEEMINYLSSKYHILEKELQIKEELFFEIEEFKKKSQKKLLLSTPFYQQYKALEVAQDDLVKNKGVGIEDDFSHYLDLENISFCKIEKDFWSKELMRLNEQTQMLKMKKTDSNSLDAMKKDAFLTRKLLQEKWKKSLDEEYLKWEIKELQKYREEFTKKLEEWLKLLEELIDVFSSLSLFDRSIFFDLSKENISLQDIQEIKRWVEYLSKDKALQELLKMLGKLRQADKNLKKELVKFISHFKEQVIDIDSKEEIVGITIGRDLAYALPQELALLSDEESSLLFDMKYVEGRIMSFDMQGMSENIKEIQEEKLVEISEDEKKGPIIICVDTSSSMQGAPETIAKAITLYMATKAIEEKRACYLINFSTGIDSMDLSGTMGISKVIEFLQKSFYGGTDATPALFHAVDMLQKEAYKKADILMISDFVMENLSQSATEKISKAKENNNAFYSLAIGNLFLSKQLKSIFDNEWVYNPDKGSVEAMVRNLQDME